METVKAPELVLCLPAPPIRAAWPEGWFLPIRPWSEPLTSWLTRASWVPRDEDLERGPGGAGWLQVVPYATVWDRGLVFAYRRPARGGDPRLRGKVSIGIGGHVHPSDVASVQPAATPQAVDQALRREVAEELGFRPLGTRLLGLVRDDSSEVGLRHLGVVYRVGVPDGVELRPDRAEVEPLGWWSPAEPFVDPAGLETWSAIVWDYLVKAAAVGT
jgi:predicted NUDIX family phosphoesterase